MLEELSEKLEVVFKNLRGQGKLTEANIRDALRDMRRVLLEADVNYKVAKRFLADVEEKAIGNKVLSSITPAQLIVKIVHDELVEILGGESVPLVLNERLPIIMVCGLQGSGKTTSVVKLAFSLKKKGKRPVVASVDIHRPAAIEQLKVFAQANDISVFKNDSLSKPVQIAEAAYKYASENNHDVFILDTAGRLHIDEDMMNELKVVHDAVRPNHVLFVADGMTGQDAVNAATGFKEIIDFNGVILTKIDGDARGGAALSIRSVTGRPIYYVGTGERIEAFEQFYPERFASRILGMGDIVSLVERAQEVIDEKQAKKLQEKIIKHGLTLDDFLEQLQQMKKMGPLEQIMGMLPGVGKKIKDINVGGDSHIKKIEAIILSMTRDERLKPNIIDGSRRKRIARGSGTTLHDVNGVLKQFQAMQRMIKKFSGMRLPKHLVKNMSTPI
jgi:signal recognition particle subunit SRP54